MNPLNPFEMGKQLDKQAIRSEENAKLVAEQNELLKQILEELKKIGGKING